VFCAIAIWVDPGEHSIVRFSKSAQNPVNILQPCVFVKHVDILRPFFKRPMKRKAQWGAESAKRKAVTCTIDVI